MARTERALGGWLAPAYGDALRFVPDLDQVEALAPEREALWARMQRTSFLSDAEKREAVGYGEQAELRSREAIGFKYRPDQPRDDLGRWVEDGGGETESGFEPTAGRGRSPGPPPKSPAPAPKPGTVPVPPGATIRNKDLANKKHPDTGIPFDSQGFPDFSSVAAKTVTIPGGHTGTNMDFSEANRAAKLSATPPGMTWHHHQDGRTMQLVPRDIHFRTGHTGSRGIGNLPGRR